MRQIEFYLSFITDGQKYQVHSSITVNSCFTYFLHEFKVVISFINIDNAQLNSEL